MRRYKLLRCGSPGICYNSCYMFGVLAIVSKIEAKAYIAQCILRAARSRQKNQRQIILTERRTYQYKVEAYSKLSIVVPANQIYIMVRI